MYYDQIHLDEYDAERSIANLKEFINDFKRARTDSIDLFLSRNTKHRKFGVFLICLFILNYELNSKFSEDFSKEEQDQDWYYHIFNEHLTNDILKKSDLSKFANNNVTFITFNYDRSLENFLFESLRYSFTDMDEVVKRLVNDTRIIHVYGKIAPLEWEDNTEGIQLNYKNNYLIKRTAELVDNIQIIYDMREEVSEEIQDIISEAREIFFLGFGYGDENLDAINFSKLVKPYQSVFGTAMDYKRNERDRVVSKILTTARKNGVTGNRFKLEDCDSKMLLRLHLS